MSVSDAAPSAEPPNLPADEADADRPQTLVDDSLEHDSAPNPALGRRLGRFTVLEELGRGGMGTVLHAFDETLDRQVALKLMHNSKRGRHDKRMLREAQALARLSHPNVVQVYDVGEVDGRMFIAMELVSGQSLEQWHRKARPWRECVDVYVQAGRGLTAAHAVGLVHRDFKPSNAIIDPEGRVRVLDFGLARDTGLSDEDDESASVRRSSSTGIPQRPSGSRALPPALASLVGSHSSVLEEDLTRTGAVLGTLAYMAPEQVRGRSADVLSDQFSFCASLYQGLFGRRPFKQGGFSAITMAMDGKRPEPPPGIHVPRWLMAAVMRGLQVDPSARWPSLESLLDTLERRRRPRWPRWVPLGIGVIGVGSVAAMLAYQGPPPCEAIRDQLDGVWDAKRQQALEDKFRQTGLPFAERTWSMVQPRLDAYAQDWLQMRTTACEGQLRETHNPTRWARRVDCLDYDRVALTEAVGVLLEADVEVVTLANQVVAALPPLSRCEDDEALQGEPRPERPEDAWAVAEAREAMARVYALREAGKYEDALAEHVPLLERARRLDYGPLLAEALALRGGLHNDAGRLGSAQNDLDEAYTLALQHGAHDVAVDAAVGLVVVLGYHQAQADTMRWLGPTAISIAQWRDPEGLLMARALSAEGLALSARGEYVAAKEHHERARTIIETVAGEGSLELVPVLSSLAAAHKLAGEHAQAEIYDGQVTDIIEQTLGEHHPLLAQHLTNLGAVRADRGELSDALTLHERALSIYQALDLMQHPQVAHIRANLGLTLVGQGRYQEAQAHCEAAITVWEEAMHSGSEHPWVSQALNCIGAAHLRQGQWSSAQGPLQRAVQILRRQRPYHSELIVPLINLGTVLEEQGDKAEAERYYREAIEVDRRNPGGADGSVVAALNKLGSLAYRAGGRDNEAVALHQQALQILDAAPEPEHRRRGVTLWALGRALARTGQPVLAEDALTRSLAAYEQLGPEFVGASALVWTAEQALADLRWADPKRREEARGRIEAARSRYDAAGQTARRDRAAAWLTDHPVR